MFAHILVLLCGCACALSGDHKSGADDSIGVVRDHPDYLKAYASWQYFVDTLKHRFLSSGSIVNNYHVVIFNVINKEALVQSGCSHAGYDDDYKPRLQESVPEALSKPREVVNAAQHLVESVKNLTANVTDLLSCSGTIDACNKWIDALIHEDIALIAQAKLLLIAGDAANNINQQSTLYDHVVRDGKTLTFVIEGQTLLKEPVLGLAEVYRQISLFKNIKC